MPNNDLKTAIPNYESLYDKERSENAHLKMMLADADEHCKMLKEEVARLSAIKATVEVIFGRKFDA